MARMTTQQVAKLVGGDLKGPGDAVITGVRSLEEAGPSDLSFVAKKAMCKKAAKSRAGALITAWTLEGFEGAQITCKDPELAVSKVLEKIRKEKSVVPSGISDTAVVSPRARLGERVAVGHHAVIEDGAELGDDVVVYPLACIGRGVKIGPRTTIHPHVTICDDVQIGADCTIHPNCVIGDDGFGYIQREGRSIKMSHVGSVRIGNNVDIRGLTSVDRGMVDDTVIGDGVKIDKHCQIAHNCRIGDNTVIAGCCSIGGSVTLGKGVILAGEVGIADHVTVGDGAVLAARAGAIGNIPPGEVYWGMPGRPMKLQMRIEALLNKLPEMRTRLLELEKTVEALSKRLEDSK